MILLHREYSSTDNTEKKPTNELNFHTIFNIILGTIVLFSMFCLLYSYDSNADPDIPATKAEVAPSIKQALQQIDTEWQGYCKDNISAYTRYVVVQNLVHECYFAGVAPKVFLPRHEAYIEMSNNLPTAAKQFELCHNLKDEFRMILSKCYGITKFDMDLDENAEPQYKLPNPEEFSPRERTKEFLRSFYASGLKD